MEYQRGIGWVSPPRVEIPMFDGEGVVSAQMKNLVEGNQVQEEEKEDEEVLIFLETLLKKRVQPTTEGLITEVLITWLIQSVLTSMSIFKLPGRGQSITCQYSNYLEEWLICSRR